MSSHVKAKVQEPTVLGHQRRFQESPRSDHPVRLFNIVLDFPYIYIYIYTSTFQQVSFGGLLGPKRFQLVTCWRCSYMDVIYDVIAGPIGKHSN